jgi:acyl carrier protein
MLTEPTQGSERLLAEFRSIVREVTEREVPLVLQPDTQIADLGIESLALYEVLGEMERRYGVHFTDAELVAVRTVADLLQRAAHASAQRL